MSDRISSVPEFKKKLVEDIAYKMSHSKTVLIASTKNLPSSQFHKIKKNLREQAEIKIAKKSILIRAIQATEKGALQNLKEVIQADVALFFSDVDAFTLSGMLSENQSPVKARAGDIAPEDIEIQAGPTELIPGPAISELSSVGLKVSVEGGKLAIKQSTIIVKKGHVIDSKVAGVLGKLNITPLKVGFIPVAAYDSISDKAYFDIKIDKPGVLNYLRESISKSFGFSVNIKYVCNGNISYFITKAGIEEKAISKIIDSVKNDKEVV